jgi:hypothetical protein
MHIQPHDKAILFNVAMIQQKAAEMLTQLPVERRTLAELNAGLQQASHSQKYDLFSSSFSPLLPLDDADIRLSPPRGCCPGSSLPSRRTSPARSRTASTRPSSDTSTVRVSCEGSRSKRASRRRTRARSRRPSPRRRRGETRRGRSWPSRRFGSIPFSDRLASFLVWKLIGISFPRLRLLPRSVPPGSTHGRDPSSS